MDHVGKLREIGEHELELMLSWRNHPAIRLNMYNRHEIGLTEHLRWWERISKDDHYAYFMFELDGNPLGIVAFTQIDQISKNTAWAFYSSPEAPSGTGFKMEFLALEHGFDSLGLNKLFCEVLAFNTNVIRLHKKFGFQVEGTFRAHYLVGDEFVDVYRLGILKDEWRAIRPAMMDRISRIANRQA